VDVDNAALEERSRFGLRIARRAGDLLMDFAGSVTEVDHKGAIDLVTDADRASQEFLVGAVLGEFADDAVLAEEGHETRVGTSGFEWVIDPLDGTTNFVHRYPHFAVSVGLLHEGAPVFGAVYAAPSGELFHAQRGGGAFLDGNPLRVSAVPTVAEALLGTGFPYNRREILRELLDRVERALRSAHGFRRSGSAAIDLCHVAAGRLDGFWEQGLSPWDLAAGVLIVVEAGGRVTGYDGGPHDLRAGRTVASNGLIHDELRAVLQTDGGGAHA
jgi:myo-inositol-1(or 4)-monophosphatase